MVDLPRDTDFEWAMRRLKATGLLQFRVQRADNRWDTAMDGRDVAYAAVVLDELGRPGVAFRLTDAGRLRFAALTGRLVGRPLGIFFDGALVCAPIVQQQIAGGEGRISIASSGDEEREARDMADLLSSGALPLDVEVVSFSRGE